MAESLKRKALIPPAVWGFVVCLGIVLFHFYICFNAFWLPHWKGDQTHYVILSMKLDRFGIAGYNLREVKIGEQEIRTDPPIMLAFCRWSFKGDVGDMIRALTLVGQGYYDEPLHVRAPLFPYILMWSHRLFAAHAPFYGVVRSNLGETVNRIKPSILFNTQFWAAVVPLFFNLLVIFLTFLFGWSVFDQRVGLYAAFLIASNPVSIMTSYRLLTESTALFFLMASLLLFWVFFSKKMNFFGIFLAGVFAGLSILTRQTSGLVIHTVIIYVLLSYGKKILHAVNWPKIIFDKRALIFIAAALAVSGGWFYLVYRTYGNPFHTPALGMHMSEKEDVTGWFRSIKRRPHPLIFFTVNVVQLFPLFGMAILTLKDFFKGLAGLWSQERRHDGFVFLWVWVLVFFCWLAHIWNLFAPSYVQEHRYFYMAYPALAILSAAFLDQIRKMIQAWIKIPWAGDLAVVTLLAVNAWWVIPKYMQLVYDNNLLL